MSVSGMRGVGVITVAERPTRVSVAFVGLLLGAAAGMLRPDLVDSTMTVAAGVWFVLALVGLGQLMTTVRRELSGPA